MGIIRFFFGPKFEKLKKKNNVDELVKYLENLNTEYRKSAAKTLEDLGYTPRNEKEQILFLVAAQKWDELSNLNTTQIDNYLIPFLDSNDSEFTENLTFYPQTNSQFGNFYYLCPKFIW